MRNLVGILATVDADITTEKDEMYLENKPLP
jgi:hypothetical protein